jgi:hypothetical protein
MRAKLSVIEGAELWAVADPISSQAGANSQEIIL